MLQKTIFKFRKPGIVPGAWRSLADDRSAKCEHLSVNHQMRWSSTSGDKSSPDGELNNRNKTETKTGGVLQFGKFYMKKDKLPQGTRKTTGPSEKCQRIISEMFGEEVKRAEKKAKSSTAESKTDPGFNVKYTRNPTEEEGKLTQKIESIKEVPIVEAQHVEEFDTTPKTLNILTCSHKIYSNKITNVDRALDDLATQCLNKPRTRIDDSLLDGMNKLLYKSMKANSVSKLKRNNTKKTIWKVDEYKKPALKDETVPHPAAYIFDSIHLSNDNNDDETFNLHYESILHHDVHMIKQVVQDEEITESIKEDLVPHPCAFMFGTGSLDLPEDSVSDTNSILQADTSPIHTFDDLIDGMNKVLYESSKPKTGLKLKTYDREAHECKPSMKESLIPHPGAFLFNHIALNENTNKSVLLNCAGHINDQNTGGEGSKRTIKDDLIPHPCAFMFGTGALDACKYSKSDSNFNIQSDEISATFKMTKNNLKPKSSNLSSQSSHTRNAQAHSQKGIYTGETNKDFCDTPSNDVSEFEGIIEAQKDNILKYVSDFKDRRNTTIDSTIPHPCSLLLSHESFGKPNKLNSRTFPNKKHFSTKNTEEDSGNRKTGEEKSLESQDSLAKPSQKTDPVKKISESLSRKTSELFTKFMSGKKSPDDSTKKQPVKNESLTNYLDRFAKTSKKSRIVDSPQKAQVTIRKSRIADSPQTEITVTKPKFGDSQIEPETSEKLKPEATVNARKSRISNFPDKKVPDVISIKPAKSESFSSYVDRFSLKSETFKSDVPLVKPVATMKPIKYSETLSSYLQRFAKRDQKSNDELKIDSPVTQPLLHHVAKKSETGDAKLKTATVLAQKTEITKTTREESIHKEPEQFFDQVYEDPHISGSLSNYSNLRVFKIDESPLKPEAEATVVSHEPGPDSPVANHEYYNYGKRNFMNEHDIMKIRKSKVDTLVKQAEHEISSLTHEQSIKNYDQNWKQPPLTEQSYAAYYKSMNRVPEPNKLRNIDPSIIRKYENPQLKEYNYQVKKPNDDIRIEFHHNDPTPTTKHDPSKLSQEMAKANFMNRYVVENKYRTGESFVTGIRKTEISDDPAFRLEFKGPTDLKEAVEDTKQTNKVSKDTGYLSGITRSVPKQPITKVNVMNKEPKSSIQINSPVKPIIEEMLRESQKPSTVVMKGVASPAFEEHEEMFEESEHKPELTDNKKKHNVDLVKKISSHPYSKVKTYKPATSLWGHIVNESELNRIKRLSKFDTSSLPKLKSTPDAKTEEIISPAQFKPKPLDESTFEPPTVTFNQPEFNLPLGSKAATKTLMVGTEIDCNPKLLEMEHLKGNIRSTLPNYLRPSGVGEEFKTLSFIRDGTGNKTVLKIKVDSKNAALPNTIEKAKEILIKLSDHNLSNDRCLKVQEFQVINDDTTHSAVDDLENYMKNIEHSINTMENKSENETYPNLSSLLQMLRQKRRLEEIIDYINENKVQCSICKKPKRKECPTVECPPRPRCTKRPKKKRTLNRGSCKPKSKPKCPKGKCPKPPPSCSKSPSCKPKSKSSGSKTFPPSPQGPCDKCTAIYPWVSKGLMLFSDSQNFVETLKRPVLKGLRNDLDLSCDQDKYFDILLRKHMLKFWNYKSYEPWIPIPSYEKPKKDKKQVFRLPKSGYKELPPPLDDPNKPKSNDLPRQFSDSNIIFVT